MGCGWGRVSRIGRGHYQFFSPPSKQNQQEMHADRHRRTEESVEFQRTPPLPKELPSEAAVVAASRPPAGWPDRGVLKARQGFVSM